MKRDFLGRIGGGGALVRIRGEFGEERGGVLATGIFCNVGVFGVRFFGGVNFGTPWVVWGQKQGFFVRIWGRGRKVCVWGGGLCVPTPSPPHPHGVKKQRQGQDSLVV